MQETKSATGPIPIELTAGTTYYWCSCGRSKGQPFCDGSHKGTTYSPLAYTPEKSGIAYLCTCKKTASAPLCDGSHAKA
jgi:CDGSH-type Zn-finger protein